MLDAAILPHEDAAMPINALPRLIFAAVCGLGVLTLVAVVIHF
jgi:hypothetical protein